MASGRRAQRRERHPPACMQACARARQGIIVDCARACVRTWMIVIPNWQRGDKGRNSSGANRQQSVPTSCRDQSCCGCGCRFCCHTVRLVDGLSCKRSPFGWQSSAIRRNHHRSVISITDKQERCGSLVAESWKSQAQPAKNIKRKKECTAVIINVISFLFIIIVISLITENPQ